MRIMIVGNDSYSRPFQKLGDICYRQDGTKILDDIRGVDLLVFTGGADVDPALYSEVKLSTTQIDKNRDIHERLLYNNASNLGIPMVGICRGSQFLNVMNGGKLIQHASKHLGVHNIINLESGETLQHITSTHHQISVLSSDGVALAIANQIEGDSEIEEIEAFVYPKSKCLGVQFHPEHRSEGTAEWEYFVDLVERHVL